MTNDCAALVFVFGATLPPLSLSMMLTVAVPFEFAAVCQVSFPVASIAGGDVNVGSPVVPVTDTLKLKV